MDATPETTQRIGGLGRLIRYVLIGVAGGVAVAAGVAGFMALWAWVENPGGIYHGPEGTTWRFVWDTAVSWFLPVLAYAVPATSAVAVVVSIMARSSAAGRTVSGPGS